jgi:hypothetical protein
MARYEVPDKPPRRPTMQVNCRVPADVHLQMTQIGELLNIDLTSVLNLLIVEGLPKLLDVAAQKAREVHRAGAAFYKTFFADWEKDPVVRRLVDTGRKYADEEDRRKGVVATVILEDVTDPQAEEKARIALEILRKEDEKRRIHKEFLELAREGAKKKGKS